MTALSATARSLSARLLVFTIFFVMLAEVLIYTPSIARFRLTWLEEKLAAGHLAALSVAVAPEGMVTPEIEQELLNHVGAYVIDLRKPGEDMYMLGMAPEPATPTDTVDLRDRSPARLIVDAFDTLFNGGDRVIRLMGMSPRDPEAYVELVLDEAPLRAGMVDYSNRILGLSIVISLFTAGLVFLSLRRMLVVPMTRLTEKMVAFRENPEDGDTIIRPSGRSDEIGVAQRQLHDMQIALRGALKQKERLAALGTGITKINHDLRNILSTAALLSERLGLSDDPEVKRTTPRLLESIDRAVELCQHTLAYTRENAPPLRRSEFPARALVDSAEADATNVRQGLARWVNDVPDALTLNADREQLLRALVNLGRNAFQAGAGTVTVGAETAPDRTTLIVADDGPGLPPRARDHLFQPFAGTARAGGTGLGLAIAREVLVAHKGDLRLRESTARGTIFELILPATNGG